MGEGEAVGRWVLREEGGQVVVPGPLRPAPHGVRFEEEGGGEVAAPLADQHRVRDEG